MPNAFDFEHNSVRVTHRGLSALRWSCSPPFKRGSNGIFRSAASDVAEQLRMFAAAFESTYGDYPGDRILRCVLHLSKDSANA